MKVYLCLIACCVFFNTTAIQAEVRLDGSVGDTPQLSGNDIQIPAHLGQQVGNNLFHSFAKFSINAGESVTFSGDNAIANVISRVTGGEASYINGVLRSTIDAADFYFINPAGIMFGEQAMLDVAAGFYASTANQIKFSDGSIVHTDLTQQSQFSHAPIEDFGFGASNQAISVDNSLLAVSNGNTLALHANHIDINSSEIDAPQGQIQLSATENVHIDNTLINANSGDVFIQAGQFVINDSEIHTSSISPTQASGNIQINADQVQMTEGNKLFNIHQSSDKGGNIDITASESITLSGISSQNLPNNIKITNLGAGESGQMNINAPTVTINDAAVISAAAAGTGAGGTININASSVALNEGSLLSATTLATGSGGAITINAEERIDLQGVAVKTQNSPINARNQGSAIASNARGTTPQAGSAGQVNIITKHLNLSDGAQIGSMTTGAGEGGTIQVQAETMSLSGADLRGVPSGITASTIGSGDGGQLQVDVKDLHIRQGASFTSSSNGTGKGGDVVINARGDVSLSEQGRLGNGSVITANSVAETPNAGDAGTIKISAQNLTLTDGGQLGSSSFGSGQGGSIVINVAKDFLASGYDDSGYQSGLLTLADGLDADAGDAGTIEIKAGRLQLENEALVVADTNSAGKGGNVKIHAHNVDVNSNAVIAAGSFGTGTAGDMQFTVTDKILLNEGFIETSTTQADGGGIDLSSSRYLYMQDSDITTSVGAAFGDGGNINLDPKYILMDNSRIIARAVSGDGGNININTQGIYRFPPEENNPIDASSQFGLDGIVEIKTPEINTDSLINISASGFLDLNITLDTPCDQRIGQPSSRFILKEREGVATQGQDDFIPSYGILSHEFEENTQETQTQLSSTVRSNPCQHRPL